MFQHDVGPLVFYHKIQNGIMNKWTLAPCLRKAIDDLNKAYPKRSKLSDGTIGDQAHASRKSDHNPNSQGIVTAIDLTHNPENGLDCNTLISSLLLDARVKYLIFNRKIYYPYSAPKDYNGENQHKQHLHISIKANAHLDMADWPWTPKPHTIAIEAADDASTDAPAEAAKTQTVIVEGDAISVKTTEGVKAIAMIAIEKPPSKNFASTIKTKITTVAGGTVTLATVREYSEQARLFGLSARFWLWIIIIAATAAGVYLFAAFFKFRSDVKRDLEITNQLIAANTSADNTVVLADASEMGKFEEKGYTIIRR